MAETKQQAAQPTLFKAGRTICFVGGVAGGASCATRFRRLDETAKLILFDKGDYVSFANCGLPYYVGNVIKDEKDLIVASPALFNERFNIEVKAKHEVMQINREKKTLLIKDLTTGQTYEQAYDVAVLATGAAPIRPAGLKGINLPGIFALRTIPDSRNIRTYIEQNNVKRATVIGGGFIGIEMAENLVERGLEVTILEKAPQLMPVMDPEIVLPLKYTMEKHGVKILVDEGVAGFEQDGSSLKVLTDKGNTLNADMVILCIGVAPDTQLAKAAGLKLGARDTIVVDEYMKTSDDNIYAVGDAVQVQNFITHQPTNVPLAGPANRQGRIVADNLCGMRKKFRGVQGTAVVGAFNLVVAMTGLSTRQLTLMNYPNFETVRVHPNHHASYYPGAKQIHLKLIFDKSNGKILGAQAVGEQGVERRIDVISMAIQMGGTVEDLAEAELCYAPQFSSAKDPVNMAGFVASNVCTGVTSVVDWTTVLTALKQQPNDVVLLDVRKPNEVARHKLDGSVHIELDQLRANMDTIDKVTKIDGSDKRKALYVTCHVGQRAYIASRILQQHGFNNSIVTGGVLTHDMIVPNPLTYDLTPKL